MISSIKTLAIQLMVGVAFAACSSSDDSIIEQPVNPTEPKTYTMTIQASKGDDATTRGLYFADGETSKDLQVNWNGKEKVRVVQDGKVIGTLSAALSSTESTTLTGTVTEFQFNQAVGFYLLADENGKMDYTGQKGAMLDDNGTGNIEDNYDFASYKLTGSECMEAFTVDGSNIVPKVGTYIPFTSQQAIVRFELQKSDGDDLLATKFIVTDKNTGKLVQSIDATNATKTTYGHIVLTPNSNTSGTASIYNVALNLEGNTSDLRLFALDSDGNLYTYEKSGVTFTKGKYYWVKVKMSLCTKFPLKDITSEDTQFKGWYIGTSGETGDDENYAYKLYSSSVKGVIAYVGKVPGYFDNFLAMSMHDCNNSGNDGAWLDGWSAYAHYISSYASNHPLVIGNTTYTASFINEDNNNYFTYDEVDDNTASASNTSNSTRKGWRIPSVTDWRYIFYGLCGSPSPTAPAGIADKGALGSSNPLTTLNADYQGYRANLRGDYSYCTSSGVPGENNVWYIRFLTSAPQTTKYNKTEINGCLRPVFAY